MVQRTNGANRVDGSNEVDAAVPVAGRDAGEMSPRRLFDRRAFVGASLALAVDACLLVRDLAVPGAAGADVAAGSSVEVTCAVDGTWESDGRRFAKCVLSLRNTGSRQVSEWFLALAGLEDAQLEDCWNMVALDRAQWHEGHLTLQAQDYNVNLAPGEVASDLGFIVSAANTLTIAGIEVSLDGGATWVQVESSPSGSVPVSAPMSTADVSRQVDVAPTPLPPEEGTPFANHGRLAVAGTDLVDETGVPYQLRGVSTHGLAWFGKYVSADAFRTLRDDWGANVVRLALYSDENGGYCSGGDQAALRALVDEGVRAAYELGMYAIVDWHVLGEGSPLVHLDEALAFFDDVSRSYAEMGNVVYEICNEPNNGCTWDDVKAYAEQVIPVIRANDADAVVLVGTPQWCQLVGDAAADPLGVSFGNVMYTLHFYAATHRDDLRAAAVAAHEAGLPLFVSEFGLCEASGAGTLDLESAATWLGMLDDMGASYCVWSLCNKDEAASLLVPSCDALADWTQADLSEAGAWYRSWLLARKG